MGSPESSERDRLRSRTLLWCCAISCAAGLAAQVAGVPGAASSALTGQGAIEGTVVNEATREPVRGAQIVVGSEAGVPPAVTDANGHFAIRNLAPGAYFLVAQHPEFPLITTGLAASHPLIVSLMPDEQQRGLVIPLAPGGSITGRILNEDGKPVAGCSAQALQYAPGKSGSGLYGPHSATSDRRGEYRIPGLAKGHYYVAVQCADAIPVAHPAAQRGSDAEAPKQKYAMEF
jgi:Carboxypeptidase regulatory-like domain